LLKKFVKHKENVTFGLFMEGKLIVIRKLVALDIFLHGPKFILVEFGVGTPVIIAVGLWLLFSQAFWLGLYLLLTGFNYIPLLIYAIKIVKEKTAEKEVQNNLEQDPHYNRKYSIQQLMLFIPLLVLVIAVIQRVTKK